MVDEPWDLTKSQPGPTEPPPSYATAPTRPLGGPGQPPPEPVPGPATGTSAAGTWDTGRSAAGDDGVRASDDDRTRTVEWLCWAAGNGQLSLDEVDGRLAAAYGARTVGELGALTSDLQARPPEPVPEPKPGFTDRVRELVPTGTLPFLIPVLVLLAFLMALALTHGNAVVPLPVIVVGFFLARSHRRRYHLPREHQHPHPHHRHHHNHNHELAPPPPPVPPVVPPTSPPTQYQNYPGRSHQAGRQYPNGPHQSRFQGPRGHGHPGPWAPPGQRDQRNS
jgi:Domain of unknown function (DUF1707)